MAIDALGNWLNLGSVTPNHRDWKPFDLAQEKPSQVIRVKFLGANLSKISSHIRIRGAYFTSFGVFHSPSVRVYPSEDTKILVIPLPDEILAKGDWQLLIEVKKQPAYRRGVGQIGDLQDYMVQVESWSSPIDNYLSPSTAISRFSQNARGSGTFSNISEANQIPYGLDDLIG
jgi:hypothetical protein